ncbi:serine hydrolase [Aegicerativicinus sediminis]|uniref:serine hydrolase n=1 Tax=Aegicerativicinus sediminis TaxID=2893202 RepID=UPI003742EEA2
MSYKKALNFVSAGIVMVGMQLSAQSRGHIAMIAPEIPRPAMMEYNELPIVNEQPIQPIADLGNMDLQKILESEIEKDPYWKNLVRNNKMAVGIVDLTNPNEIKYAGINDNTMMYAASLPKIAILLSAMDAFEKGELEETETIKNDLRLMISKSDNHASTRMIDRLGYEKIESVLRGTDYKLYDEEAGGGLWVGKRYAAGGRRYPEPLKGLSHAATVKQVCSFYYQLAMGRLVSADRSREMLDIMKDPALHHKFVNTLEKLAPRATLFRKSGSWKNYHSDSVLVWGPKRHYIIVALIDDNLGENIIRKLVYPLDNVLKNSRTL